MQNLEGLKCASMLYKTIKKEIIPTQFIEAPPMLVSIVKQFTGQEPMKSLVDECVKANIQEDVLDTSISEGYPYSDVEEMGMSWITVTNNNLSLAKNISKKLAKNAWEKERRIKYSCT